MATVAGDPLLNARPDCRGLGPEQGHGLALHVGSHQGAVGVVVLQERDERRGYAHDLHRRNVHQVRFAGGSLGVLVAHANLDPVLDELVQIVQLGVCLGDLEFLFLVSGEPDDGLLQVGAGRFHYERTNLDHCPLRKPPDRCDAIGAD